MTMFDKIKKFFIEDINEALAYSDADISDKHIEELAAEKAEKIFELLNGLV